MEKYFYTKEKNPRLFVKFKMVAKMRTAGEFMPYLGPETVKVSCLALVTKLARFGISKPKKLPLLLPLEILLKINN